MPTICVNIYMFIGDQMETCDISVHHREGAIESSQSLFNYLSQAITILLHPNLQGTDMINL